MKSHVIWAALTALFLGSVTLRDAALLNAAAALSITLSVYGIVVLLGIIIGCASWPDEGSERLTDAILSLNAEYNDRGLFMKGLSTAEYCFLLGLMAYAGAPVSALFYVFYGIAFCLALFVIRVVLPSTAAKIRRAGADKAASVVTQDCP